MLKVGHSELQEMANLSLLREGERFHHLALTSLKWARRKSRGVEGACLILYII